MLGNKTCYRARHVIFLFGFCSFVLIPTALYFSIRSFAQEQRYIYDSRGKRNPFTPLITPDGRFVKLEKTEKSGKPDKVDIVVEGIIYDKYGRSYALVNGLVVGVGDFVGDYQVLKVEQKKVLLIKEGQIREIELSKEEK